MGTDGEGTDEGGERLHSIAEWAKFRGLSQAEIVRRTSIDKSTVSRWFNGQTPTLRYLRVLAELFETDVPRLFVGPHFDFHGMSNISSETTTKVEQALTDYLTNGNNPAAHAKQSSVFLSHVKGDMEIPLIEAYIAGLDGEFVFTESNRTVVAPPLLTDINGAYAVVVLGETMEPRYFDGEVVYVDPFRRVRTGDFVVAQVRDEKETQLKIYIKRLLRRNNVELVLCQFNPEKEMTFPHDSVKSVHQIVLAGTL